VAQKNSKKSVAKKLKSAKKSAAKELDKKKKRNKSELKKLVRKAKKSSAVEKSSAAKKPSALEKPSALKKGAEARESDPVRARHTPTTTSVAPSSTWNVSELRAHARAAGVVGYSRMKKDDLLSQLRVQ
jgi:hypothetical protein